MKDIYKKEIMINHENNFFMDRSLNSQKFQSITGYKAPSWEVMLKDMHEHFMRDDCYQNKTYRKVI